DGPGGYETGPTRPVRVIWTWHGKRLRGKRFGGRAASAAVGWSRVWGGRAAARVAGSARVVADRQGGRDRDHRREWLRDRRDRRPGPPRTAAVFRSGPDVVARQQV